ncbi:MAG: X-Pro dipeptidyl-peptidase family protein [Conexibacter sp.]|nr:X-Pro dipeptidyl-peptidase family protein [Conexibacter sp.]
MRRLLLAALLATLVVPSAAHAADVPPGATWSQQTITEADGTRLHADILRPSNLPADARTPVILSIGPYFNHSGQTGPAGPVEGTGYDPVGPSTGPSDRFSDFVEGAHLMERGYTFVMVDLRGFGGSSGCLDWAGPGEQADVKAAVEWAASQAWSTGKVGMYGKSYDGVTGLIGAVSKPAGLAAVVSQEPVYDLYRYLYSDGIRYENSLATPALYDLIADTPGPAADDPSYNANGMNDLARPGCPALNWLDQQDSNHDAAYWKARNLIPRAAQTDVPVFLTQGFLENNTKPDGAYDFYNNLAGPKRAWLGMWDHVRGNETDAAGRLKMGRPGWFDEVMRWFDRYVKGDAAADPSSDPAVEVQTSDGSWRSEAAWPPADATPLTATLKAGSYRDDATNNGSQDGALTSTSGQGAWTFSPPLTHDAHLAGLPKVHVELSGILIPKANLVADLYDVAPDGKATLIARQGRIAAKNGAYDLQLYGQDWLFPAGHRVGVLITGANAEWWTHLPTLQTVTVTSGSIALPWLARTRASDLAGGRAVRLDEYEAAAPFTVDAATIAANTAPSFALPPAMTP